MMIISTFFSNITGMHLNPLKTHPERITKADRQIISGLDYSDLKFPVSNRIMVKLKRRIVSALMCLVMRMIRLIQSMYWLKNSNIAWICC